MAPIVNTPPPPDVQEGVTLGDYVNKIVVLNPLSARVEETSQSKETEVVVCNAWAWEDDKLVDLGELWVFWKRVRNQLEAFIGKGEFVVGLIQRNGRAYELVPVDAKVAEKIAKALDE